MDRFLFVLHSFFICSRSSKHTHTHSSNRIHFYNLCITKHLIVADIHTHTRSQCGNFNRLVMYGVACHFGRDCVRACTCRYDNHWVSAVLLLLFFYGLYCVSRLDRNNSNVRISLCALYVWILINLNVSRLVVTDKPYVAFRIDTIYANAW